MKYLYGDDTRQNHEAFLRRVGGVALRHNKGPGPKAPPKHTAKGTKNERFGGNRKKCERYRNRSLREQHKKTREQRDSKRAKLLDCGHGSRHIHPQDGECRRCFAQRLELAA